MAEQTQKDMFQLLQENGVDFVAMSEFFDTYNEAVEEGRSFASGMRHRSNAMCVLIRTGMKLELRLALEGACSRVARATRSRAPR